MVVSDTHQVQATLDSLSFPRVEFLLLVGCPARQRTGTAQKEHMKSMFISAVRPKTG